MRGASRVEKPKKGIPLCVCEKHGSKKLILRWNLTWLPPGFSK